MNGFIKALRRSAFGYQDFDYFALLIWEQTHENSMYGKPSSGGHRLLFKEEAIQPKEDEADCLQAS